MSCRRAWGFLQRAEKDELIKHAPHYAVSSRILNRKDTCLVLHTLIAKSALPLASLEDSFAIDGTGFRTNTFGSYCQEKHGPSRKNNWIKAIPISGCLTNVIPAVIVTGSDVGEAPLFPDLLKTAINLGFKVTEISADKTYLSRVNYTTADDLGISAYIPFRSDSSGLSKGAPIWRKMFYRFHEHRDEFEQHYHKRENVETDFSSIKRTLQETLKSKNRLAQQNELLCKILAYNIMVIIHEAQKHDISLDFSGIKADKAQVSTLASHFN